LSTPRQAPSLSPVTTIPALTGGDGLRLRCAKQECSSFGPDGSIESAVTSLLTVHGVAHDVPGYIRECSEGSTEHLKQREPWCPVSRRS
jgi:hypothetical protein